MAKQKKKRNKKYKQKYTTDNRVDYRQGGRVSLAHGGMPIRADYGNGPMGTNAYNAAMLSWNAEHTANDTDPNRQDRVERTGERSEEIAQGNMVIPAIPEPKPIDLTDTTIDPTQQTGQVTDNIIQATPKKTRVVGENVRTEDANIGTKQYTGELREAGIQRAGNLNVETAQRTKEGVGPAPQQTLTDTRDFAQAQIQPGSKSDTIDGILSSGAFAPSVVGQGGQVSTTANAEKQTREAIVDNKAIGRDAEQIIGTLGYDSVQRRTVTGEAAKGAAASMIAQTANIPQDIAAAIVENPASVEAKVDTNPVEVNAAIAALPTEALVSSQMETLLAGMEDNTIPLWAKPAVDSVNQNMATRGMLPSTVGRDALFNAIIQSAFPMAQGNAQALQQRAAQNLSNEQQANLQQATQEQQLRMANLANRQTAESQTAQNAQQMKTMQSQFNQQAILTTAEQQQQTRTQNLQNQQQAAVLQSQNQQAINVQELGNEQQIEVANLQIEAQAAGADQVAENQERLVEMQVAADFMSKNTAFRQDMSKANLSEETKIRLANLSALNQAESEKLSTAQQTELANLNKRMQVNIKNSELAQQLGVAQLNVDQQTAMQKANVQANMDMTKFSNEQQVELANSKFMQTITLENMNAEQQSIMQEATALAQLDVANLNTRERIQVENAKNFLSYDMANLETEQQSNVMRAQLEQQRLLSDQAAFNAAQQFNATSENQRNQFMANLGSQMEQYNTSQLNSMKQFNAQSINSAEARRSANEFQSSVVDSQIALDAEKFNSQQEFARDQFNSQQEMVVAQSNVEWRRKANTADTAAFNAVNQQNAQNAYNLTAAANNFLWQELRDEADHDFKRWDNDQQRKASLLIAALGNEEAVGKQNVWNSSLTSIQTLLEGWLD